MLFDLGECAGAEALSRGTLAKRRRVLSRDHHLTLVTFANLALSLSAQGKHTEATEFYREVLVSTTRLLTSAANLALSLSDCGKKTEAEQLLRDTLALARRALGPNHAQTQSVLRGLRKLAFAAR